MKIPRKWNINSEIIQTKKQCLIAEIVLSKNALLFLYYFTVENPNSKIAVQYSIQGFSFKGDH